MREKSIKLCSFIGWYQMKGSDELQTGGQNAPSQWKLKKYRRVNKKIQILVSKNLFLCHVILEIEIIIIKFI
jgi:hypothetical protein